MDGKHCCSSGITFSKRMNLPQSRYELSYMADYLINVQPRIIKRLFLFKVIFDGFPNVWSRYIEYGITTKYPFFFGNIVISDLSSKFEYTIKYSSMDSGQSSYSESKRTLVQELGYISRNFIGFLRFVIFFSTNIFRIVVTLDKLLYFINGYIPLNMLTSSLNKIFGGLQAIYRLKSYCRLPRIAFFTLLRLALLNVFVEV